MNYKAYVAIAICSLISFGAGQCSRSGVRFSMQIPPAGEHLALGFMSNMTKLEVLNKIFVDDQHKCKIDSYETLFENWGMVHERIVLTEYAYKTEKVTLCLNLLHDRLYSMEIFAEKDVIVEIENGLAARTGGISNDNIDIVKKDRILTITDQRFWEEYMRFIYNFTCNGFESLVFCNVVLTESGKRLWHLCDHRGEVPACTQRIA